MERQTLCAASSLMFLIGVSERCNTALQYSTSMLHCNTAFIQHCGGLTWW